MIKIEKIQLQEFLKEVYEVYDYNFIDYNYSTLIRRIGVHCIQLKIDDFYIYSELILDEQKYFNEMFEYFSINVTEFFREAKQLNIFRKKVVSYLNSFSHIKIWCAGCSTGESPYSLAILLDEMGILEKCQIYATDFNNRVLAQAKEGLFAIENFNASDINYKLSGGEKEFGDYFIKQGKYYKIKNYLKKNILFFNHNLVSDGVMNEFQLIICKNVVIYFDKDLKETVMNLFDKSLVCNGFLIFGQSEYLPNKFKEKFKLYIPKSKVYHKKCK